MACGTCVAAVSALGYKAVPGMATGHNARRWWKLCVERKLPGSEDGASLPKGGGDSPDTSVAWLKVDPAAAAAAAAAAGWYCATFIPLLQLSSASLYWCCVRPSLAAVTLCEVFGQPVFQRLFEQGDILTLDQNAVERGCDESLYGILYNTVT